MKRHFAVFLSALCALSLLPGCKNTGSKSALPKADDAAIKAGAPLIMTAHVSLPKVIGDKTLGTLSSLILTDKLRGELGYRGIIITDAMGMGAISQHYDKALSAVMCLKAGADIILMPEDLPLAFEAVVNAVGDGTLSEERIDQSVYRVLALKHSLGRL